MSNQISRIRVTARKTTSQQVQTFFLFLFSPRVCLTVGLLNKDSMVTQLVGLRRVSTDQRGRK